MLVISAEAILKNGITGSRKSIESSSNGVENQYSDYYNIEPILDNHLDWRHTS